VNLFGADVRALDVEAFLAAAHHLFPLLAVAWLVLVVRRRRPSVLLAGVLLANAYAWLETNWPLQRLYALGPSSDRVNNLALCQVVAAGHSPLHTPQVLGSVFLQKPESTQAVLIYTILHGLAFVVFGLIGALVMAGAERYPMLIFGLVILFTAFEVFFFGGIVIVASWVLDEVAGWTIFVGNILAAGSMLAYYFLHHRTLTSRLAHSWAEED